VTGATGYVGRVLVDRLLSAGATVRALVREPLAALPATVERAVGDLARPGDLDVHFHGVDAVVHCAAEQHAPSRARHRVVNVAGTRAVLEAAATAGVFRVVHLSSIAVYPRKDGPVVVTPDEPLDPFPELRDDYAWSKIGAERWVALHGRGGRLEVVTLRLGIVYGRGRDYVARVWRRLGGPFVAIAGTPRMRVPLVHVDDVVEAVGRALEARRRIGSALHVVGPDAPTQAAYLARRATIRGERMRPIYVPIGLAAALARRRAWHDALRAPGATSRLYALAWTVQETRYDLHETERVLGWTPRITIEDGLDERTAGVPAPVAAAV